MSRKRDRSFRPGTRLYLLPVALALATTLFAVCLRVPASLGTDSTDSTATPVSSATATPAPTATPNVSSAEVHVQGSGGPVDGMTLKPPGPTLTLDGLTILDNPSGGGDAALVRLALGSFGAVYRPDGVPWSGWCEMFVGDVLVAAGIDHPRYPTALADALSGPLYRGRAPAGSLVFFDARISADGHVGIALGDGTMLSALGGGIVRTTYEDWPSYVGWRPARGVTSQAPMALPVVASNSVPVTSAGTPAAAMGPKPASMAIGPVGIAAGIAGLPRADRASADHGRRGHRGPHDRRHRHAADDRRAAHQRGRESRLRQSR